jgi:protein SCO1/2
MRATTAAFVLAGALGCAARDELRGRVPENAVSVGEIALPEVRAGRPDTTFAFRAAPGGLLYVYFGFTRCPDICPTALGNFRDAVVTLDPAAAARVEMAFVTVDLARDSAAVMVPFLASFTARGHALIPRDPEQLGRAQSAFRATSTAREQSDGTVEVSHTGLGYVVDDAGAVAVQWDDGTRPDVIAHDLRLLLSRNR